MLGDQARYADIDLAPDGMRVAVSLFDPGRRTRDIWLFDIARGLRTRLTFDPADEFTSVWSPDGSRVVFNSRRKGHFDLYMKAASGAGAEEELLADSLDKYPFGWSPDGRFILFVVADPKTGFDLWVLPLFGDRPSTRSASSGSTVSPVEPSTGSGRPEPAEGRKPFPFLQTQFNEAPGQFSPDGRWTAYVSDESGRDEVYVAAFPGPGGAPGAAAVQGTSSGKWQVSTTGGNSPRWRRDGREIFYLAPDNKLMAAPVNGQVSAFEVGAVRPLFDTRPAGLGPARSAVYDVSPDGQRFLVNTLAEEAASAPITLVVNWPALLKK
jgi:Tol biopolymer transport system component